MTFSVPFPNEMSLITHHKVDSVFKYLKVCDFDIHMKINLDQFCFSIE